MSAFECNLTPTRFRKEKKLNEDREPTFVDLRPFSAKAIVTFEDVPVSKVARRLVIISNPFDDELHIILSKKPKPELNVHLEWETVKIPAQSQANLEIVWSPLKVVSCREIIQITENNGNKKDIAIIFKSCEPKKKTARKIAPAGYPKKLKLKTPSPPSKFAHSKPQSKSVASKFRDDQEKQPMAPLSPLRNATNLKQIDSAVSPDIIDCTNFTTASSLESNVKNKENTPNTPKNASALFNHIRFTPVTEKLSKCTSRLDYLASLPTPTTEYRGVEIFKPKPLRSNVMQFDLSPKVSSSNHCILNEVESSNINTSSHKDIPSILITETVKQSQTFITTEEINEIDIVLEEQRWGLENTRTISSAPLEVIDEEAVVTQTVFYKTFEVNKSHSLTNIVEPDSLVRVTSESMCEVYPTHREEEIKKLRVNQGSMPNLNEFDYEVEPIENNRYFRQQKAENCPQNISLDSIVSNTEFRETEICAQSSRYNLLDFTSPSKPDPLTSSSNSPLKPSLRNVQFSECSSEINQRIHSSPTIRRIQQDPCFKSPPKKTFHQMIFSPPARNRLSDDVREMERRNTFDIESRGRSIRATTWKQQQNQNSSPKVFAVPRVPRELNLRPSSVNSKMNSQSLTSLSSLSLASTTSTSSTPAVMTKGRLYNEKYVNAYNNNDPFSATTTNDPFLSSTMYLDEQTLDGIEKTYKKWLNALVTIPPDLESDKNEKIDVGKLFNDVQNKELILAPTKEAVCSRYYTSRLDSLRMAAVQFFHSETISTPLNKITVVINEKNKLEIKAERNIHLDLVLQRSLLELLLCYNPLWLRIGLEVIFNVQLNLQSNKDILGMSRFIVTNMFKSQYLAEKYSKFSQQKEYLEKLRKFTVKNFLFIIFFLDRAKESRLIKQNPCLFAKRAPYKDSKDILKKFASLVLANYGDIIRMLGRWDYVVTHKQTVIDEFDFAFKNLAVDLRDGVRLTKVMEIILLRDDLVQRVRVPAISRLQKVHNVDLALKALESANYQILGNITSKDIADGHREKTLSLLWQIIYKFRAPRFNTAAKTIQKFWRSKYLMVIINRRIKQKQEEKQNRAATVIQKYFRGWKSRQASKIHREQVTKSVITIQKYVRSFIIRRRYKRIVQSVVRIQRWFRSVQVVRSERNHFCLQRKSSILIQQWWRRQVLAKKLITSSVLIKTIKKEAFIRHRAATIIQRSIKSFTVHKKLQAIIVGIVNFNRKSHLAATKIQSYFRMKKAQKKFKLMKQTATTIQFWWRHKFQGRQEQRKFVQLKASAVVVQTWYRRVVQMRKERAEFLAYRNCVVRVQQRFRSILLMRKQRIEYQELRFATLIIQQQFRARQAMKYQRTKYQLIRNATVTIQRRFRAHVLMKVQRQQFIAIKTSVIVIQRKLRATLQMKKERKEFLQLKSATVCIQTRFRAQLLMKEERNNFLCNKTATVNIQRRFRAQVAMKKQRNYFQTLKRAAVMVQQRFRANQLMKKERSRFLKLRQCAIKIQQRFRSTKLMRELTIRFYSLQYFAAFIQQKFRAKLAMVKARNEFLKLKEVTIFIQRRFRANKLGKEQLNKFNLMKKSAVIIQRKWRATMSMYKQHEQFQLIRKQTVFVQSHFRANKAMKTMRKRFEIQKTAAIKIQRWFRSSLEKKMIRNQFLALKKTVLLVENRIIANKLMCIERKRFVELRQVTMIIQQKFRAKLVASKVRSEFLAVKAAAISIQQRFRANQLMKKERSKYLKMRQSAIKIQERFRSTKLTKELKILFCRLKFSATFIQQKFRAKLAMVKARNEFLKLKAATIFIQRCFRTNKLAKEQLNKFNLMKKSAVIIQRKWRATIAMNKQREQFQLIRNQTVFIQRRFRANQAMKSEQKKFIALKIATIVIQRWFRSCRVTRIVHNKFLVMKKTVLLVENRIIANRLMSIERTKFVELRETTTFVQRRFRSKIETRVAQKQFKAARVLVVKLQSHVRGYLARRRFEAMKTPEQMELRKRHKAARMIQAAWRGYQGRTNRHPTFRNIVERLTKATKNVDQTQTLAAKLKMSLDFLRERYESNVAISFLAKLEYMSRTVPWILIDDAEFIAIFCYGLMSQAIRSEVDKQIIELCSCIILNLSRFKDTKENAFQEYGLMTIAQMLLRWCDKDCGIFNTLCTLVWVFAHCEQKNKIIRDFIMADGEFIVSQIKQNVLRKENMRKNSRRPIGFQSISLVKYKKDYQMQLRYSSNVFTSGFITPQMLQQCKEIPSFQPDYGVVKTSPYIFYSSVFAFDQVIKILGIQRV